MADYCESCGRKTRYWVREADTGVEYPACTPQGCNDTAPDLVSPLVTCDGCEGVGIVRGLAFATFECPVCLGAGQTTAVRHRAWELTRDLTGGPVLLDPDCWWAGGGTVLVGPNGQIGRLMQLGNGWMVILPNGRFQDFPGRDMAEVYLYEQYREVTA